MLQELAEPRARKVEEEKQVECSAEEDEEEKLNTPGEKARRIGI